MAGNRRGPPVAVLLRCLHRALLEEGCKPGQKIPRDAWDDLVIVAMDVQSRGSISQYTRAGVAHGLWDVTEAHGKGGRGYVTLASGA